MMIAPPYPVARRSERIVPILAPTAGNPVRTQLASWTQLFSSNDTSFAPSVMVTRRTSRWFRKYVVANASCVDLYSACKGYEPRYPLQPTSGAVDERKLPVLSPG